METTRKRQRANSNGDSVPSQTITEAVFHQDFEVPEYDLSECIEALLSINNGITVKVCLLEAAKKDLGTAIFLRKRYNEHIQSEQSKVIDCDRYSKSVWSATNTRYSRLSGSKQYNMAFEVLSDAIRSRSALETLRKIGKTICMSEDVIGHEVRKQFQHETALEDTMTAVIFDMSDEERERMCAIHDGRSTFLEKMDELQQLAEGHCIFAGLEDVIADLTGEGEDENEDETGEDGEDEEVEEEREEESPALDVPKYDMYGRDPMFDNSEEEEEWIDCYDSCDAPKNDVKSRWVFAKYERRKAQRG